MRNVTGVAPWGWIGATEARFIYLERSDIHAGWQNCGPTLSGCAYEGSIWVLLMFSSGVATVVMVVGGRTDWMGCDGPDVSGNQAVGWILALSGGDAGWRGMAV